MTKKTENTLYRLAILDCIKSTMETHNATICHFNPSSYDMPTDMVRFTIFGKRCTLLAVELPDLENGTMNIKVFNNDEGNVWLKTGLTDFRCDTLKRIGYEVYDNYENQMDWDNFVKEKVANHYDSYDWS